MNAIVYEEWRSITDNIVKGVKPYYSISNLGKVYSSYSNDILRHVIDSNGYEVVCLQVYIGSQNSTNRRSITVSIARLIMLAFCPIANCNLYDVHHKDHDKSNNFINNLEWLDKDNHIKETVQYQNNMIGCHKENNMGGFGEFNPMSKLTNENILEIVSLINSNRYSYKEISDMYNVSPSTISSVAKGLSWNHLNLDLSNVRISSAFTNQELHDICSFFESVDINDKNKYPSLNSIYKDCAIHTGICCDNEVKRKTMERLLYKSRKSHDPITGMYNYNFIR